MDTFESNQTNKLKELRTNTDVKYLKKCLAETEKSMPECAAESLYRTNKLSILRSRIDELNKTSQIR